jgi:hypothetical protein
LNEVQFQDDLRSEQRRMERSGRPFVVVRIAAPLLFAAGTRRGSLKRTLRVFSSAARQTDTVGWLETGKVLGVICTELGTHNEAAAGEAIFRKIRKVAARKLRACEIADMGLELDAYSIEPASTCDFQTHRARQLTR